MSFDLPRPIGRQREVLCLPATGHVVVLGTAGSGKTTLAIHRAAYLANRETDHGGPTLLVTFNRCLVAYLEAYARKKKGVDVRNYHQFARGYLAHRGKMRHNAICDPSLKQQLCAQAVALTKKAGSNAKILSRPIEFLVEEFSWLSQVGIQTEQEYTEAERVNRRGTRVAREDRAFVFAVYTEYKRLRATQGKDYDWDDLASAVRSEFETDRSPRMYRHVVIDEGQDFSPEMVRSLASAIPAYGSLTFFGDMAQQIYGNKISWRSAGLVVKDVWKFEENYRNTKQIARLALTLAKTPYFRDVTDLVEPKAPTADGPKPSVVAFSSPREEIQEVAKWAQQRALTESVAVLFRDREQEGSFPVPRTLKSTRLHRDLKTWPSGPGLYVGTYHAAKGLEFDAVWLPYLSRENLPYPSDVATFGEEDTASRDIKLLYVAVTRARANLILSYSGEPSTLLPLDAEIVQRIRR